ncbi:MAG: PilZ domain-containing protein [Acidobacteriota bacterium]|nr:PilZ domain-containing protein [Acidobacteriota bacterium]
MLKNFWHVRGFGEPRREQRSLTQTADERRSNRRYRVEGVRGQFLFSTDARVIDMSLNGMSLEIASPLKVGREYSLKLDREDAVIQLKGTIVWCTLVRTTRDERGDVIPVYRAGIHLEDVISGKAGKLMDFIQENAIVSLEKRLFGRFRVETEQSADLGFEAEFQVIQLSLSGMLVETEIAPPVESRCRMEIEIGEMSLDAESRVVRVETVEREPEGGGPSIPIFSLGVEFADLTPESVESLETFIRDETGS